MKVLFVILALLVVALSVTPCCTDDACATDEVQTEQSGSHDDDAEVCSPFYSCSTCTGFTVSDFTVENTVPVPLVDKPFVVFKLNYLPPISHAIWQPPKIS